jgi:putative two-component system response regulator
MNAKPALRRLSELRIGKTFVHECRVGLLAEAMCKLLGMSPGLCAIYRAAAELHDVGKLALPEHVLDKPGRLSAAEYALVQRHTEYGHDLLTTADEPQLALAAEVALLHHERWDGSGYPHGLRGEAIPLAARLIGFCDVYSALREERAYKTPLSHEAVCRLLLLGEPREEGLHPRQFDPDLLAAFAGAPTLFQDIFAADAG